MVVLRSELLVTNEKTGPRFINAKNAAKLLEVSAKQFRRLVKIVPFKVIDWPRPNGVKFFYLRSEILAAKDRVKELIHKERDR